MAGGTPVYASPMVAVRSYDEVAASDSHGAYHQIVLGIDGAMELAVDGLAAVVDTTLGMVIPAGERHDYLGVGPNRQLVIDVPVDALTLPRQLFEEASLIRIDPRFQQWVMSIAQLPERADRFAHWQAAAQLCDALLVRSAQQTGLHGVRFTLPRIDAFLRAHLAEPLSIPDLAAHCGCGVRTFHDRFVGEFGITPHRYLLRLRTEQAARLMNDARRSLADIAATTGFTDQSALTHAFVARFGITPGRWRGGVRMSEAAP
ncbi:AraC family transcriptional regulator [Pararobbsia alpina]|uniref:HTH-type transcriptional activator RhaS n=1 Tax=Pararobbsia alpina TaxID=621374 RepID=A0A6S7BEJ3_9BURK|nr:AraC family transcriptional regulator [Pararobbsia alpina]CAB3786006.1 HTH-type transcriptional activator RhaS [Pararobbsia alpina]